MDLEFSGEIWLWRGPAPWHFVTIQVGDPVTVRLSVSDRG